MTLDNKIHKRKNKKNSVTLMEQHTFQVVSTRGKTIRKKKKIKIIILH